MSGFRAVGEKLDQTIVFFLTSRTFITHLTQPNRWSPDPQSHEEPPLKCYSSHSGDYNQKQQEHAQHYYNHTYKRKQYMTWNRLQWDAWSPWSLHQRRLVCSHPSGLLLSPGQHPLLCEIPILATQSIPNCKTFDFFWHQVWPLILFKNLCKISLLSSWFGLLIKILQKWLKFDYIYTNFFNKTSGQT